MIDEKIVIYPNYKIIVNFLIQLKIYRDNIDFHLNEYIKDYKVFIDTPFVTTSND